jgi:hypothetical protein
MRLNKYDHDPACDGVAKRQAAGGNQARAAGRRRFRTLEGFPMYTSARSYFIIWTNFIFFTASTSMIR